MTKHSKKFISERTYFVAENTGWSNGTNWFPTYELSYDSEEEAKEANKRHQKSFSGKINYRILKITTVKEQIG
jgi:hypothetical protein